MGRVNNAPSPKMKHFSHHHELDLWSTAFQPPQPALMLSNSVTLCSACQLPSSEFNMYICRPCNFFLHLNCAQLPQLIIHPAHWNHTLTLLAVAAYPGGIFNCDACNRQGNGFSYHCGSCEYDLHVLCASKPLKFTHQAHSCQLELTFTNPYDNAKGFLCDVCLKFGSKQWLYRCSACEFDVHLDCATASPATAPAQGQGGLQAQFLQHRRSFPGGEDIHNQVGLGQPSQYQLLQHHHQYMHSASLGGHPMAQQPQLGPTHTAVMGVVRPNVQLGAVRPPTRTSGLMNAVVRGLVEGPAQQVGQSLVQGVIGGGGTGGGWDGSSMLGSLFGDSSDTQN